MLNRRIDILRICALTSILLLAPVTMSGENPDDADRRYTVQIDIRQAYLSGICIMQQNDNEVTAGIVNEFGVSALTFRYDTRKGKVRILNILRQMDKPHIRMVLKKDLKVIMSEIYSIPQEECYRYENTRHNIKYNFKPF